MKMDDFLTSRFASVIRNAISCLNLDFKGLNVVTECATGFYTCTPIIAALSGATKIVAFGKDSSYGTYQESKENLLRIWKALDLNENNLFITDSEAILGEHLKQADIVTNSGNLRPLDFKKISAMKQECVIPLMYETWEFRSHDISLESCCEYNIAVAGTNERHPDIAVFDYLGPLTAQALFNAGLEINGNYILLVSDNDFSPYVEKTLTGIGAQVIKAIKEIDGKLDAIVFAHTPTEAGGTLDISSMNLPREVPICCQLWGNVDRTYFRTKWIPEEEPKAGHMGLMLSSLGIEPIVRLQAGGLKVGEILVRARQSGLDSNDAIQKSIDKGFGQILNDYNCTPSRKH